jgi:hypothetical protein
LSWDRMAAVTIGGMAHWRMETLAIRPLDGEYLPGKVLIVSHRRRHVGRRWVLDVLCSPPQD